VIPTDVKDKLQLRVQYGYSNLGRKTTTYVQDESLQGRRRTQRKIIKALREG
jgi:hypothetical protein